MKMKRPSLNTIEDYLALYGNRPFNKHELSHQLDICFFDLKEHLLKYKGSTEKRSPLLNINRLDLVIEQVLANLKRRDIDFYQCSDQFHKIAATCLLQAYIKENAYCSLEDKKEGTYQPNFAQFMHEIIIFIDSATVDKLELNLTLDDEFFLAKYKTLEAKYQILSNRSSTIDINLFDTMAIVHGLSKEEVLTKLFPYKASA